MEIQPTNIEYIEDDNWFNALKRNMPKGYRKTYSNKYETFVSYKCKNISLGTYDNYKEAERAVLNYRISRLVSGIQQYGLNINDSIPFMNKYLAFRDGSIFNLFGEKMVGSIDKHGYRHVIINGKNINVHRIIATLFCYKPNDCNYVNHIDGNKQNNNASNLEWTTRSSNTKHSFGNGLQNNIAGVPIYTTEEKAYIKSHCFDNPKDVAKYLGRNKDTVRKYMYQYRKELNND